MNKKIILPTILFIAVLILSVVILSKENKNNGLEGKLAEKEDQQIEQNQIVLFYGDGCPHCAIVEKYIEENKIKDKISFAQKEVYYNQNNAKELATKAEICEIPANSIGVPLLWNGEGCLIGDQDIINFFKQKINE